MIFSCLKDDCQQPGNDESAINSTDSSSKLPSDLQKDGAITKSKGKNNWMINRDASVAQKKRIFSRRTGDKISAAADATLSKDGSAEIADQSPNDSNCVEQPAIAKDEKPIKSRKVRANSTESDGDRATGTKGLPNILVTFCASQNDSPTTTKSIRFGESVWKKNLNDSLIQGVR